MQEKLHQLCHSLSRETLGSREPPVSFAFHSGTSGRKWSVLVNFGLQIKQNFKFLSPDPKLTNSQGDTAPHPTKMSQEAL